MHYQDVQHLSICRIGWTLICLERAAERKAKKDGGPEGKIQDSIKLFGSDVRDTGATIGVNSLLWRILDTISFMPLDEADPYGGIIMTEWYNNPNNPNERYKITIYISILT